MGSCCVKANSNYVVEEKREEKKSEKQPTSLMETDVSLTLSDGRVPSDKLSRRLSSIAINPGEEELFSKKINLDSFDIEKVIGKGGYGKVFLVTKVDTQKWYAMKEIKKETLVSDRDKANTIFERVILQNVKSPFIVNMHFAFQTSERLYYVLDFWSGGELFFHLKKKVTFKEKQAKFYAAEIVLALEELHKNNIVYRDLKPENILLDSEGHVKLTDFGLSKFVNLDTKNNKLYTFAGTPEYLAPEIINEKGYGKEVDWWSLGAILYEMLVGVQPFHHNNHQKLLDNILFKDLRFPELVGKNAKDLCTKLLERRPEKRLGWGPNGVDEIKQHKFFSSIDWDKLLKLEIIPPFKPKTKFEADSRNFDKEFTEQRVEGSDDSWKMTTVDKENNYIRDFTYYTQGATDGNGDKIDVVELLMSNINKTQKHVDPNAIAEANEEDEEDTRFEKSSDE